MFQVNQSGCFKLCSKSERDINPGRSIVDMIYHIEPIRIILKLTFPGLFYSQTGDANLTDWLFGYWELGVRDWIMDI
jgi:hypothetical protein